MAETHIQLNLIATVEGLPANRLLKGLFQFGDKKWAIALNEILNADQDFAGIGVDSHVYNTVVAFFPEEVAGASKIERRRFVEWVCRTASPAVGWWANEIIGQLGQLLKKEGVQRDFSLGVFHSMVIAHPEYDELVDKVVKIPNWGKSQRGEEFAAECGIRKNDRRSCRGAPSPERQPLAKKRKSFGHQSSTAVEAQVTEENLSPYERLRLERIERNKAKLKELELQ